ncbi:MAG: GNAT family N-acetyltransferase [Saprospiraceae bacterium]
MKDNPFVHDQAILHIDQMAVHPDFQNQGIGMALLHHVKEEADRLGIKKITLDVSVENHTAFALYSKAGFTPTRQVMEWNL